jgi:hypothetical protein
LYKKDTAAPINCFAYADFAEYFLFSVSVTSWPGLNRIDRILISTRYTFFSGSSSEKNSGLSVLGLEQFEDG